MVEGQPLRYYNVHSSYVNTPSPDFSYFHRFNPYYPRTMELSEDLIMPPSPNSTQSDSDNSISSVEISPKSIKGKKTIEDKSEVQCCWRSCGIFFLSLDQLATHVSKVHASGGPGGLYYCGWEGCSRNNKGFNARYKMLVHVRTHTNEKPHQCYQCDKSFSRAENLKIHSRSHSGEKPYVCPVPGCNKAYSNSSDRFKHTRTHQVEKPYQCKVPGCPKRYTDPSSLRKHVKTYKHFINENNTIDSNNQLKSDVNKNFGMLATETDAKLTGDCQKRKSDERVPITQEIENVQENLQKHACNCTHVCCVSNCINKAAEILRLGALINFKKDDESIGWNRFLDPFVTEQKSIFSPYELTHEDNMDVDVPLDLSIHRKNI